MLSTISLISLFTLSLVSNPLFVRAAAPYVVPGQKEFPSAAELSAFNRSIAGKLHALLPYASVCYNPTFDASACQNLFEHRTIGEFRIEIPDALMYINWELDDNGKGCPEPLTAPTGPLNGTCEHGALAPYEVFAESAQDVSAAVKFAAKHNLRLRIKNTGHDYLGRSSAPGSFTIWTHKMNSTSFLPAFTPKGCSVPAQPAVVTGPAVTNRGMYEFGDKHNVQLCGGYPPTVGATGGWALGGGLGPIAYVYGMGVDNVLQFTAVTADGQIRIVNECTNTDLFWALRGGGGAFAVVTEIVWRANPPLNGLNMIAGTLTANSTESWEVLLKEFLGLHQSFEKAGLGGLSETSSHVLVLLMYQLFTKDRPPVSTNETFSHLSTLLNIPGVTPALQIAHWDTWLEAYNGMALPIVQTGGTVGDNLLLGDTIGDRKMFSPEAIGPTAQVAAQAETPVIYQFVAGGAVSTANDSQTSVHPAWRTALVHFNMPIFSLGSSATPEQHAAVVKITAAVDAVLYPDGNPAGYYNEDYAEQPNHQQRWWGSKYPRLLEIKKKVDPNGVFSCRACVGAEIFGF